MIYAVFPILTTIVALLICRRKRLNKKMQDLDSFSRLIALSTQDHRRKELLLHNLD